MSNRIRCKFTCISKRQFRGWGSNGDELMYDYEFSAVTNDKTPENKVFWKFTPSGKLNVSTVMDGTFEVSNDYYLDLTPCDKPA
jgi:hypothetical protein